MSTQPASPQHSLWEDLLAIVVGTLFVSFGIALFKHAGLLTGGTAGFAFIAHYLGGWPFGAIFFAVNVPFYYLAFRRVGWRFTLKTFGAVALVSVFAEVHPLFIQLSRLEPFYAAIFAGLVMGVGFIILFRHQASLGGVNILALFLQDKYKIRAGMMMLAVDLAVLLAAFFVLDVRAVLASVLGALAMNMVIWINHRRDRYVAWSAA